jgi:hypothetical protein
MIRQHPAQYKVDLWLLAIMCVAEIGLLVLFFVCMFYFF